MTLAEIIGHNVQRFRKEKGWSQSDMCRDVTFLSQSRLSQIENGDKLITIKTIEQLAALLEVQPFELLVDRSQQEFKEMEGLMALSHKLPPEEREALQRILHAIFKSNGLIK